MTEGVVCLCSRGLVNSHTYPSIWRNLKGRRENWEIVPSHDKPIPDAQNYVTEEAMKLDPSWLWYVEEDHEIPDGCLENMISMAKPVVTADYRMPNGQSHIRRGKNGIEFCGMGCLLVSAGVISEIPGPLFKTTARTGEYVKLPFNRSYGGQDIDFSRKLIDAGIEIAEVPVMCRHFRLEQPGKLKSNQGVHRIVEL